MPLFWWVTQKYKPKVFVCSFVVVVAVVVVVFFATRCSHSAFWRPLYHVMSCCTDGGSLILHKWWKRAHEWCQTRFSSFLFFSFFFFFFQGTGDHEHVTETHLHGVALCSANDVIEDKWHSKWIIWSTLVLRVIFFSGRVILFWDWSLVSSGNAEPFEREIVVHWLF